MKRLTILVVLVALAWSGYWLHAAQGARSSMAAWFEDRRSAGWQAEYGDLAVRGFPNRVDATFTDLALADPEAGLAWRTPVFQILQLVYRPGHRILAFADTQTIATPRGRTDIASDGLVASLVVDEADRLLRAGLEAQVLNIDGPGGGLALAGLKGGLQSTRDAVYRIGLSADAAAATGEAQRLDGLDLQAEVTFDRPLDRATLLSIRPQPRAIDLRLAEYRQGAVYFRAAGRLTLDDAGRASGTLQIRADNWQALIDRAVTAGHLPRGLAQTLEDGLSLVAGLSGDRTRIELPLTLDAGRVRLGPIPLGEAPRLRIP